MGIKATNALSRWLEVEVRRDGLRYRQRYEHGHVQTPVEILESLETITGLAALDVLATAYRELPSSPDGLVELEAADGRVDVISRLVTS